MKFKDYLLVEDEDFNIFLMNYLFDHVEYEKGIIDEALKIAKADPKQPWDIKKGEDIESIYQKAITFAKNVSSEFKRLLKRVAKTNTRVLIDFKSLKSFSDKVLGRNKSAKKIHDVLRGALLFDNKKEVEDAVKFIKKKYKLHEYDFKSFGGDKEYGYFGSHHFGLVLKNNMIAELQVMTKNLWNQKAIAHGIYDKYRSLDKTDMTKEIEKDMKKDMRQSKIIFSKGNLR